MEERKEDVIIKKKPVTEEKKKETKRGCQKVKRLVRWLVGCVLRDITPCSLFNTKSYLYVHIKYVYMIIERRLFR